MKRSAELAHLSPVCTRPHLPGRFRIEAVHGEGGTVYHVIDTAAPEPEQPAVVASWRTPGPGAGRAPA